MPIYHQGRKVKEVYHQGRKVKEIWHMGRKIYTSRKPVEVMPPTKYFDDAQYWLRNTVRKYGLNYQTVTELPFDIDSRNATTMAVMFDGFSSLTTVPQLDTSNVTTMYQMFYRCSSLTTVPALNTRNVTNMNYMFTYCPSLTSVPDMATSQVTNMTEMLMGCARLTDGNVRLIGKHPQVNTSDMITNSGLTREPFYNSAGQPI